MTRFEFNAAAAVAGAQLNPRPGPPDSLRFATSKSDLPGASPLAEWLLKPTLPALRSATYLRRLPVDHLGTPASTTRHPFSAGGQRWFCLLLLTATQSNRTSYPTIGMPKPQNIAGCPRFVYFEASKSPPQHQAESSFHNTLFRFQIAEIYLGSNFKRRPRRLTPDFPFFRR